VLTNGASFSVTAEFAAVTHFLKRATFIGEETGGGYYGNNSGTFVIVTLPNSRLNLGIPMLAYYTAVSGYPYPDRGILPDYPVKPTILDLVNGKDVVMEFALDMVRKKNGN
jgi:C-terminal processing protease CtpA/Prc